MYPGNRTPWNILIKITGDHAAAFDRIAGVYSRLHPDGAFDASFIEDQIADTFSKYTQLQKIIIIFTVIAIFVSSLGLFAMSTYYIRARSRNIAVEKVFGADKGLILRQIASSYLLLSLIAFIVSVPVSWLLTDAWLSQFSYSAGAWRLRSALLRHCLPHHPLPEHRGHQYSSGHCAAQGGLITFSA